MHRPKSRSLNSFSSLWSSRSAWRRSAAARRPGPGRLFSITFFAMICSLLGIALGRGARRVYWSGFATLGWSYLLLIYRPLAARKRRSVPAGPEPVRAARRADSDDGHADSGGMQSVPLGVTGSDSIGRRIRRRWRALRASPISSGSEPRWKRSLWAFLGGWVARYFASGRAQENAPRAAASTRSPEGGERAGHREPLGNAARDSPETCATGIPPNPLPLASRRVFDSWR